MNVDAQAHDPRYPIGAFVAPAEGDTAALRSAIGDLSELPELLRHALDELNDDRVEQPYRAGGWTLRQVVHHIADSHMNAFIRVRKALTEEAPTVSDYDESAWATLHDFTAPVEWSLALIENLHARWVLLLQSLTEAQWQRTYIHPARGPQTIALATMLYAWHGRHHLAQITHLRTEKGW